MILIKLSVRCNGKAIAVALSAALLFVITVLLVSSQSRTEYTPRETSNTSTEVVVPIEDTEDKATSTVKDEHRDEGADIQIPNTDTATETAPSEPIKEPTPVLYFTEQDVIDIAKVLYRECRGIKSKTEQACVVWTILNRVDEFGSDIYTVVRAPNQYAFIENTPVWEDLSDLARDVLTRWSQEKAGEVSVGRVLPKDYLYFEGDGSHNYFKNKYDSGYNVWDYSLESPYDD